MHCVLNAEQIQQLSWVILELVLNNGGNGRELEVSMPILSDNNPSLE